MRRVLAATMMAVLMALSSPAQAMPTYGWSWKPARGYYVWAENDRIFWITTTCRWWASGRPWTWKVNIPPHYFKWVSSDRGYGNQRPSNLHCSYRRY